MSSQREGDHWSSSAGTGSHISSTIRPTAKYNPLSDSIRQITSGGLSCSMFCGGKSCKYESATHWTDEQMAIKGLYSSWVTDTILAMARPNTENIEKYDIIKQFKQQGIKSVINLQRPGEHASCGRPLEPDEFSYVPQMFMDKDIFFYNFGWDDYGVRSLTSILDMVKVMSFAITQGKVAVHCHAGLGRTGVLIACYLVYDRRMDGDHAITYVREKRQGAIQTKGQIECVTAFSQFLIPLRVVFSSCDPSAFPFTLDQYLNRQRHMLHGYEARELKYIPKVVKIACRRLQELAKCIGPQLSRKSTDLEIMKTTAPGAFQSRRNIAQGDTSNTSSAASIARSSSTENVSSRSSLTSPDRPQHGQLSPLLDFRKKTLIQDEGDDPSSDDDSRTHSDINLNKKLSKHRPKVAHSRDFSRSKATQGPVTRMPMYRLSSSSLVHDGSLENFDEIYMVAKALMFDLEAFDEGDDVDNPGGVVQSLKARVSSLQQNLNVSDSAWQIVTTEEDPFVLCLLMWSWLEHLMEPVLSPAEAGWLVNSDDDPVVAFKSLKKGQKYTIECILNLVACLQNLDAEVEDSILYRVTQAICHIPRGQLHESDENCQATNNSNRDEDDESFSASQFLVFLRQYVFHLRLRLPDSKIYSKSPASPREKHQESHSSSSQSDEARDSHASPRRKQVNGKAMRRNIREEEEGEEPSVHDMPIPSHKKGSLPPIF